MAYAYLKYGIQTFEESLHVFTSPRTPTNYTTWSRAIFKDLACKAAFELEDLMLACMFIHVRIAKVIIDVRLEMIAWLLL